MNGHCENPGKLKPIEFDSNARRFLSNKLAREITAMAAELEDAELFMTDKDISPADIVKFLQSTGKFKKISEMLNRFVPVFENQISELIQGKDYSSLGIDPLIQKLDNKLRDSFKGVDFEERPVLKMVAGEFFYMLRLYVIKYRKVSDEELKDDVSANIQKTRKFGLTLKGKIQVGLVREILMEERANRIYERLCEVTIPPTDEEIVLKVKEDGNLELIKRATASKEKNTKPLDFLTVKIVFESGEAEQSFLSTLSLTNRELNGWGSSSCSLENLFQSSCGSEGYQYIRYKIFEAIEDAILEDRLLLEGDDKNKPERSPVIEETTEEVHAKVEDAVTYVDSTESKPTNGKKTKKEKVGGGQFLNIKLNRAASALLRFEGVIEVKNGTNHGLARTFRKLIDGKIVQATLLPANNKSDANPVFIRRALDTFKIPYKEFFENL